MEAELGNREMAGRVVVEIEVVKEVLAELLNEIPAFKVLVSGEGSLSTRRSGTRVVEKRHLGPKADRQH